MPASWGGTVNLPVYEKVLLILSAESSSCKRGGRLAAMTVEWVQSCRDPSLRSGLASLSDARIREYFIPDSSGWKEHDKYKKASERLLGDLKAGEKKVKG
jgi:hypothetical protein